MTDLHQQFPSTRWSSVLAARDARERTLHLDHLCRAYWTPVYCYIRRAWGKSEHESLDLTQDFFIRLLEYDFLKDVDPAKGRFRTYLKACLRNFLLDAKKYAQAQKRGGAKAVFSLDAREIPSEAAAKNEEDAFDLEWVASLLRSALPDLEKALRESGRELCYTIFHKLDVEPSPGERPSYADLARQFAIAEQTVKSHADYARKLLRKILLEKIRDGSLSEQDALAELRELFKA